MQKRIFQILIILIVNASIFWLVIYLLPDSFKLPELYMIISGLTYVTAFLIFANRRSYEEKLTWILIILFLPVVGFLFYLLFGLDYSFIRNKRGFKYKEEDLENVESETIFSKQFLKSYESELDFINLIDKLTFKPINFHTRTLLLNNGDEFFPKLFEELEKASDYIHLEYFIIKNGDIASKLEEVLVRKSLEGVEVRVLFDYMGSISYSSASIEKMREAGVQFKFFNPISFKLFLDGLNYRNHRKITVIDGKVGFTGGLNIGDEYNHQDKKFGFWRDAHIMLEGDAVRSLHIVFMKDWYYVTGENLMFGKYLTTYKSDVDGGCYGVQVIDDGPDIDRTILKDTFFKAINNAKKSLRIVTPYFIPDSEIIQAIKVAALSGVDVSIIVPGKPDKQMVYNATKSYFEDLLQSGCKIYTYGKNFIHSKILIVDDLVASIGTTNFDFRSFHLHFENTVLLYGGPTIDALIKSFNDDIAVSNELTYEKWSKRSYRKRFSESFARLFSPLF